MEYFELTETQLDQLAREVTREMGLSHEARVKWVFSSSGPGSSFLMLEFGVRSQHHFRLDLLKFESKRFQSLAGESYRAPYKYRVTSLHIKAEETYGDRGYHAYLYLNYVGGGVWQPIWGYSRPIQGRGPARKIDLTSQELASAYRDCHQFMDALTTVLRTAHGLACGPTLGAEMRLDEVGLQGEGIGRI